MVLDLEDISTSSLISSTEHQNFPRIFNKGVSNLTYCCHEEPKSIMSDIEGGYNDDVIEAADDIPIPVTSPNNARSSNAKPPKRPILQPRTRKGNSGAAGEPPPKKPNTSSNGVLQSVTPHKGPRDANDYRVITLSNGLRAILIREDTNQANFPAFHHNNQYKRHKTLVQGLRQYRKDFKSHVGHPTNFSNSHSDKSFQCRPTRFTEDSMTSESANVSMSVNTGYLNDPEDYQGLAHFTEHVVHYGSKKYPQEDLFGRLTTDFGVHANAFTEESTTCYYYNIKQKFLSKSLDLFAHMLFKPKFDEDIIRREVESIDNEFILKSFDFCTHLLLFQSLAKEGHPFRNFGWGDRRTLNKTPAETKRAMTEFHAKYYVPNAMTLCVNTTLSLDEMEALVVNHFNHDIASSHSIRRLTKVESEHLEPFKAACNSLYVMQGCGNKFGLSLRWVLPADVWQDSTTKTLPFIINLLGNETETSLAQYLKNEGYILELGVDSCPCDHHWNDYNTLLDLRMILTNKGYHNSLRILSACHSYIDMLAHSPADRLKPLFAQLQTREQRNFNFAGPGSSLPLTIHAARSLQRHLPEDILVADSWAGVEFDYNKIISVIQMLNRENLMAIQILKSGEKMSDLEIQREKYSGVKYTKLPASFPVFSKGPQFTLSTENLFGSEPLDPLNVDDHGEINASYLDLIEHGCSGAKSTASHYGHRPNSTYKSEIKVDLISSLYVASAVQHTLGRLWANSLAYQLLPLQAHAERVGCTFGFFPGRDVISLRVQGYPDKITDITRAVVGKWLAITGISESCFNMAKEAEMLTTDVVECGIMDSLRVTANIINYIGDVDSELFTDTTTIVQSITYPDLVDFVQGCKNACYVYVEGHGNIPVSTVAEITQTVNNTDISPLFHNPLSNAVYSSPPLALPLGERCVRILSECTSSRCTLITNVYEFGPYEPLMHYMCTMVEAFMNSRAFHRLRLREQLGYFVATSISPPGHPISFSVSITATAAKHTPCELDRKIDAHVADFENYFDDIPQSDYMEMARQFEIPPPVTKDMIKQWLLSKLRPRINDAKNEGQACRWKSSGISKTTIQVLGLNGKSCNCSRCKTIKGWPTIRGHLKLAQVQNDHDDSNSDTTSAYFVHDLSAFKKTYAK